MTLYILYCRQRITLTHSQGFNLTVLFWYYNISMIPKFFTENKEDRIAFVEFIQHNKDTFEKLLDKKEKELEVERVKYTRPNNKNQSLEDTFAFSKKKNEFQHVKNTYNYFIEINVGDAPVRGELLYDLDTDEIQDDGFMEHTERRKQIKEFEKWLHTEDVKKEFAKKTMKNSIKKHHIENLKDNLEALTVRPPGEKDPGGLTYQKTLGKWEERSMSMHDKTNGVKVGGKKTKKNKKIKTKKYRKTRRPHHVKN